MPNGAARSGSLMLGFRGDAQRRPRLVSIHFKQTKLQATDCFLYKGKRLNRSSRWSQWIMTLRGCALMQVGKQQVTTCEDGKVSYNANTREISFYKGS